MMRKIENYMELCKGNFVVYTNEFYTLSEINKIKNSDKKFEFDFHVKGLNEETEKKILAICPKNFLVEEIKFPVKFFKIINKSRFRNLEHKHYLGTILSLGLKREILGDLIVKNNICYGIIRGDVLDFLKENLSMINTSPVEIIEIMEEEVPKSEFEDLQILVTSPRLDNFVSALTNLSRALAASYISMGNVLINYEVCNEKSFILREEDVISIKKYGKYIVGEKRGLSKKSKLRMLVKKYI